MKKLCCKCGNITFAVSRDRAKIRCNKCFTYYEFKDNSWVEMKKPVMSIIERAEEAVNEVITRVIETTGEIRKRLGIEKLKPRKVIEKPVIPLVSKPKEDEFEKLRAKWAPYYAKLMSEGEVEVDNNTHYGTLRGKDILRKAKSDFRKIGLRTRIEFTDKGAKLKLAR